MTTTEVCGATYGTGRPHPNGTAVCARPAGHPEVGEDGIGHSPDPIPIPPRRPRKSATEAMNLRPRQAGKAAAMHDEIAARLEAVLALHTESEAAPGLCRECLTAHPCSTVQAARAPAPAPTPDGVESQ